MFLTCRFFIFLTTLSLLLSTGFGLEKAFFAGGCFWCMEHDFEEIPGVLDVTSGYIDSVETVEIVYDPDKITYSALLTHYWKNIDPTTDEGQFCDKGSQYRPVIFYLNEDQKKQAEASKQMIKVEPNKVAILPVSTFEPAKEYHQNYAQKNPFRYKFYRRRCGRDARLRALWGGEAT